MKHQLLYLLCMTLVTVDSAIAQEVRIINPVRLLALGDSYTIGQSVEVNDRWPVQLGDTLTTLGLTIEETKIVAMTGWTTGSLLNALNAQPPNNDYTLVSLLIGVNNQYSGGSIQTYAMQFEELLTRSIAYAGGDPMRVFVLSIPDYAYTPFGQNQSGISEEIDTFNAVNEAITISYGVPYINITDISRRGLDEPELVASDGLHPSAQMYALWVRRILEHAQLEVVSSSKDRTPEYDRIRIYPNPVTDKLCLKTTEMGQARVLDLSARVMLTTKAGPDHLIDVAHLAPGTYLLEFIGKSGRFSQLFTRT